MFSHNRVWSIAEATSVATLAYDLTQTSWTLCQGFRLCGYLFLNDSTSENGAQEFAVVREEDCQQVESITFGWCTEERAAKHLLNALAGDCNEQMGAVHPWQIESRDQHGTCYLCA
jgi:hypothetical protein